MVLPRDSTYGDAVAISEESIAHQMARDLLATAIVIDVWEPQNDSFMLRKFILKHALRYRHFYAVATGSFKMLMVEAELTDLHAIEFKFKYPHAVTSLETYLGYDEYTIKEIYPKAYKCPTC